MRTHVWKLLAAALLVLALAVPALPQSGAVFIDILNGKLTSSGATVTTSKPLVDLTQTWNAGGQTFTGMKLDVTDTASAAGSMLIDLQIATVSKFKVDKSGNVTAAGSVTPAAITDRHVFYPAVTHCVADSTNMLTTRVAANDWSFKRTATGAETYNFLCSLTPPFRTGAGKGYKLTALSIAHSITGNALTSGTFTGLATTTYANAVANAVASHGGSITITMPTESSSTPYLTAATIGTPAFMVTASAALTVDFQVVMQAAGGNGIYEFFGLDTTWTEQL